MTQTQGILIVGVCDGEEWSVKGPVELARTMAAGPDLLAALEGVQTGKGCFDTCRWEYSGRHHGTCIEATYAIAKAKGETPCAD